MVAASDSIQYPAIGFELLDQVSALHLPLLFRVDESIYNPGRIFSIDLRLWGWETGTKGDVATTGAKLLGKTLANAGVFAVKIGYQALKEAPARIEKRQEKVMDIRTKFEIKDSQELLSNLKKKGYFDDHDEELVARQILIERRRQQSVE